MQNPPVEIGVSRFAELSIRINEQELGAETIELEHGSVLTGELIMRAARDTEELRETQNTVQIRLLPVSASDVDWKAFDYAAPRLITGSIQENGEGH